MTASLEIRLLGPFEVLVGGRPAEVTGPKRHALLVLLALRAARLKALRTDALEEQFEAALALGEHTEVVGRIRRVLAEYPFRERLWEQLMLGLYRSGRQAEALEAFGQARRVLAEELGVEPGPGLGW